VFASRSPEAEAPGESGGIDVEGHAVSAADATAIAGAL
jgi:hypothetical protein